MRIEAVAFSARCTRGIGSARSAELRLRSFPSSRIRPAWTSCCAASAIKIEFARSEDRGIKNLPSNIGRFFYRFSQMITDFHEYTDTLSVNQ